MQNGRHKQRKGQHTLARQKIELGLSQVKLLHIWQGRVRSIDSSALNNIEGLIKEKNLFTLTK